MQSFWDLRYAGRENAKAAQDFRNERYLQMDRWTAKRALVQRTKPILIDHFRYQVLTASWDRPGRQAGTDRFLGPRGPSRPDPPGKIDRRKSRLRMLEYDHHDGALPKVQANYHRPQCAESLWIRRALPPKGRMADPSVSAAGPRAANVWWW